LRLNGSGIVTVLLSVLGTGDQKGIEDDEEDERVLFAIRTEFCKHSQWNLELAIRL
jgi:hypothetical protein